MSRRAAEWHAAEDEGTCVIREFRIGGIALFSDHADGLKLFESEFADADGRQYGPDDRNGGVPTGLQSGSPIRRRGVSEVF